MVVEGGVGIQTVLGLHCTLIEPSVELVVNVMKPSHDSQKLLAIALYRGNIFCNFFHKWL